MKFEEIKAIIEQIIEILANEKIKIDNKRLLKICGNYGKIFEGQTNSHLCHELAETAFNLLIKRKYARKLLTSEKPKEELKDILKPLAERLPTETWRSTEQIIWQQFSTPPAIAYLLAYLLNLQFGETVLEPSAGTGSLAIWASGIGLKTYTNEIDSRRRILLELMGFEPTSNNAEFINDYLPPEITADCLMMNPPFSSNGGRTKNNSSKFGFRHVESALERLKKGGRFGIILGEAGGLDTKTGNDFWRKLSDRIEVKTIIKIDGREYYKNGTTVDTNLIVGKKFFDSQPTNWNKTLTKITCFSTKTVEEAFEKVNKFNLRLNQ